MRKMMIISYEELRRCYYCAVKSALINYDYAISDETKSAIHSVNMNLFFMKRASEETTLVSKNDLSIMKEKIELTRQIMSSVEPMIDFLSTLDGLESVGIALMNIRDWASVCNLFFNNCYVKALVTRHISNNNNGIQ